MAGDVLKFKNFINLSNKEKVLVLEWRNSDRIRLKMNNSDIIRLEDHLKWVENLKDDKKSLYYLFEINNEPAGVFDYTEIENKVCVCGSYIGDEKYTGYGILLNYLGFEYAFEHLGIDRINISVLKSNERVYKMHKKIFKAELYGENEKEYLMYFDKNNFKEDVLKYFDVASVKWDN